MKSEINFSHTQKLSVQGLKELYPEILLTKRLLMSL
ncbi:MAG: hypothetical protein PWR24_1588 [Desulfonauticus sp.]|jgi:hypothetical protein|nr:hypothetical protein [Desulfonauticus sp.]